MRLKWILGIIVFIIALFVSSQFIPEAIGTICYKKGMKYFYNEKNYKEAISKFEFAKKLGTERIMSTMYIAECYMRLGKYENAISCAKEILQIDPLNDAAGRGLVASLGCLGQYDEAEKVALKRASYLPYREDGYYELAEIYAMKKDFKKAYEFAVRCVHLSDKKRRLVEDRVDRRFLLSHIAFDLGYYEEVIKVLDEIQKLEPSNIGVYSGYAESYEKLSNKEMALENWKKVSSLDYPTNILEKASQKIQQFESELGIINKLPSKS